MKNGQKSIRLDPINSSSIRGINPNESELNSQSESIQTRIDLNRSLNSNNSNLECINLDAI